MKKQPSIKAKSTGENHTTLFLTVEERRHLEQMARDFGYLQTRGAGVGQLGNISAFIRAIAKGELHISTQRAFRRSKTDIADEKKGVNEEI